MKMNYLLGMFVILSVVVFGCAQGNEVNSPLKKEPMMKEGSNEDMEKDKAMMDEGFEMKGGKMIMLNQKTNAMSAMEKEMKLEDGTIIKTNGQIIRANGTAFTLKEGESIWMDGSFMKAGEIMEGKMTEKDESMVQDYKGKILAGTKKTKYLDFNKEDYDKALKENKKILLYFYASWCPLCKKEQPQTFAAFNELNDRNLVGFRVHYNDGEDNDDAKALAQQFQVPYQHTKVILKDGKQVLKAPDSWDRQRYLTELGKV